MKKVFAVLLVVGIFMLILGSQSSSGTEVRTYHKVYKDAAGEWQGKDVSYLADKTSASFDFGFVLICVAGVGLWLSGKKAKKDTVEEQGNSKTNSP